MSKHLTVSIIAILAIALIAVGCGGGSDETTAITKAQFVKTADAACNKGSEKTEKEFAAYLKENKIEEGKESKAENEAHVTEIVETIALPAFRQQVKEIRALEVPEGDEAQVKAFIKAVEEGIEKAQKEPELVFTSPNKAFAKADKLAEEYGLKVCGQR